MSQDDTNPRSILKLSQENTLNLSKKSKVNFAPDVTLHSFSIENGNGETSSGDKFLEFNGTNMVLATSTQPDDQQSNQNDSNNNIKVTDTDDIDEGDADIDEAMEFTQIQDINMQSNFPDNEPEDVDMELTGVHNIEIQNDNNNNDEDADDMEFTQPQNVLGNINEEMNKVESHLESQDTSQTMEFTETFTSKNQIENKSPNRISQQTISNEDQTMEFTQQVQLVDTEQTMEFTQPINTNQEEEKKNNSPKVNEKQDMNNISLKDLRNDDRIIKDVSSSKKRRISSLNYNLSTLPNDSITSRRISSTPRNSLLGKEKNSNSNSKDNKNIRKSITPSIDPPSSIADTDQDISQLISIEKLSPIKLKNINYSNINENSSVIQKSNIPRFTSSAIPQNTPIPQTTTASVIEKSPTKSTSDVTTHNQYSLDTFLINTKCTFILKELMPQLSLKLNLQNYKPNSQLDDLLNVFYFYLPSFEMNSFVCSQLHSSINQTKSLIDNLKLQISQNSNSPDPLSLFIRNFFENTNQEEKDVIIDILQAVKKMSYLESQKDWLSWNTKNIRDITHILQDNISSLKERLRMINIELEEAKSLKDEIFEFKLKLEQYIKEGKHLKDNNVKPNKNIPKAFNESINSKLHMIELRNKLKANKIKVGHIVELQIESKKVTKELESKNKQLFELHKELKNLNLTENFVTFNERQIIYLKKKLFILEQQTGIEFLGFQNDLISFRFHIESNNDLLSVDLKLSLVNSTVELSYNFEKDQELDLFYSTYFKHIIDQIVASNVTKLDIVYEFYNKFRKSLSLLDQYYFIKLKFPTKVIEDNNRSFLQIYDSDLKSMSTLSYQIAIDTLFFSVDHNLLRVDEGLSVVQVLNSTLNEKQIRARLQTLTSTSIPWFNNQAMRIEIIRSH